MMGRVLFIFFLVFVIGTRAQDTGTGARLLISQKLLHFVAEALGPGLLGLLNFTFSDYSYSNINGTVNYTLSSILVVPGQGVQINSTLLDGAIELDISGCSTTIYWTLMWSITDGKNSQNGSLSASSTFMFDLSVTSGVNASNGFPVVYFKNFEITQLTYNPQNYSLPPQIQNVPFTVLTYLLNTTFGTVVQQQITSTISTLDPGFISVIGGLYPIIVTILITEPPIFTPDTFSIGLSADIRGENSFNNNEPCTVPHVLPLQNRTYDFELHLGSASISCLLGDLRKWEVGLSGLISRVFFQNLIGVAYQLPDNLPGLYYVPAINTTHLVVQFSPSIDLWFGIPPNEVHDVHFYGAASTSASIDLVILTNGSAPYVEVQATARVSQLHGEVDNTTNVPEVYAKQISSEHWGNIQNRINGLIAPFLPFQMTVSPEQLQLLSVLFQDISFDAFGDWLNIRANMKSFE
jgi:hypothetical protein